MRIKDPLKTGVTKDNFNQYKYHYLDKNLSIETLTDEELQARKHHIKKIYKGMRSQFAHFSKQLEERTIFYEEERRLIERINAKKQESVDRGSQTAKNAESSDLKK